MLFDLLTFGESLCLYHTENAGGIQKNFLFKMMLYIQVLPIKNHDGLLNE